MLILFRILQGAGGGGLQPSEQAILADTFSAKQRGMAFAMYGMAVVVAPAIGPTLGGWITDNYSWHWIFLINVPIGILSLLLTQRVVHDPAYLRNMVRSNIRVDYIGIGLIVVGVGFLQYVLDKGQENDWFSSKMILVSFVVAIVALVALVIREVHAQEPDHGSAPARQAELCHRRHLQLHPRHGAQRQHHPAAAIPAERSWLHRAASGYGAVAGRHRACRS